MDKVLTFTVLIMQTSAQTILGNMHIPLSPLDVGQEVEVTDKQDTEKTAYCSYGLYEDEFCTRHTGGGEEVKKWKLADCNTNHIIPPANSERMTCTYSLMILEGWSNETCKDEPAVTLEPFVMGKCLCTLWGEVCYKYNGIVYE